jgi:Fe-S-cluster-containing hydrogenase component 2/bacterioferritin-associated ferredoxin
MNRKGLTYDGYPTVDEIKLANGWPSDARFAKGPVAILECIQEIPCNPCEGACPAGAIQVGVPITNVPRLDETLCTGCGNCIADCPGMAIFVIDMTFSENEATVSFPFEYFPLPEKGDSVDALNRAGEFVCKSRVVRILNPQKNNHTPVITIAIPKKHAENVRTILRSGAIQTDIFRNPLDQKQTIPDDVIVCRCEEISAGEIKKAIREYGATTVTDVKRRVRAGMGLCQGRTCSKLVMRILSETTEKSADALLPVTSRPPVRPLTFGELSRGEDDA